MIQGEDLAVFGLVTFGNVLHAQQVQCSFTSFPSGRQRKRLLQSYGLWEFRDKYPSQLSGGMRQRAALIRRMEPEVGGSSPEMMESRVDLPQPLGPTMLTNSPFSMEKLI